ncbi:PilZ domain-containing protein [Bdellovibrio svalbardensis]|uniref:PilZ domain-containing protein n=1 Tax=Bdellovibrio svalbardensis TaxID=2972972 RepID=A0ABT6DIJ9_9BACT|nr:PilZ domain-containing protein [Bdellovibrio svalbardensis]MDG0816613.1 PilZ domain-containing protein [Bdellovibrio svalbardensis]
MNLKIWFILNEGQVTGPFNPEEIESKIANLSGQPQIWGRGHAEWMTPGKWRQFIKEFHPLKNETDSQQLWKIRIDGIEKSPMKYSDLITLLKSIKDFSTVDLSFADSGWKEIFSFQKIVDDLEISRRSHPRVPIVGTIVCESEQGEFSCRVISISEGGLGINDAQKLKIGERFNGTLNSPNLYVTINSICEVVYVGADGYAGVRFVGLTEEFKSSIIEYVNKFATV